MSHETKHKTKSKRTGEICEKYLKISHFTQKQEKNGKIRRKQNGKTVRNRRTKLYMFCVEF